jgi:hypothetical protein
MAAPFDPELIPKDLDAQLTPEVEAWHIRSVPEAEWAMRLLAALTKEADSIQEQADLFIEQIDHWKKWQLRPIQAKLDFFQMHLEGYALELRELTGKATLALPSGKVTTHATKARVAINDEQAFWDWLVKQDPEVTASCLKQPELSLSGIQKLVTLTEVPCKADVGLSCGCLWDWEQDELDLQEVLPPPKEGDPLTCHLCQSPAVVVSTTILEVCQVPQYQGKQVPGLHATVSYVASKAKPGAA